jgi:hypothetical protein
MHGMLSQPRAFAARSRWLPQITVPSGRAISGRARSLAVGFERPLQLLQPLLRDLPRVIWREPEPDQKDRFDDEFARGQPDRLLRRLLRAVVSSWDVVRTRFSFPSDGRLNSER